MNSTCKIWAVASIFSRFPFFLDAWERCESLWVKEMWIKLQSSQQWNSSGLGRRETERKISLVAPSGNEIEWQFRAILNFSYRLWMKKNVFWFIPSVIHGQHVLLSAYFKWHFSQSKSSKRQRLWIASWKGFISSLDETRN